MPTEPGDAELSAVGVLAQTRALVEDVRLGRDGVLVGIGVDMEPLGRWTEYAADAARIATLFHPDEIAACREASDPARCFAGRWCAKEAAFKALSPHLPLDLRDLTVLPDSSGRPQVRIERIDPKGFVADASLSYTRDRVVAVVISWQAVTRPAS